MEVSTGKYLDIIEKTAYWCTTKRAWLIITLILTGIFMVMSIWEDWKEHEIWTIKEALLMFCFMFIFLFILSAIIAKIGLWIFSGIFLGVWIVGFVSKMLLLLFFVLLISPFVC